MRQPRKPTLSPSKLTTYLACPLKYRWTYVDERGKWYLRAKSYFSFGTTLHHVLQQFHDDSNAGVTTTDQVLAAYEESWIDAGFKSQDEMTEAFGEGKIILEKHVERSKARGPEVKVLMLEKQLRWDLGEFVLIGRIDRIDEHPDGTLEVIDYKSGRSSVSPEEVRSDIAMGCYQLLVHRKFPDHSTRATILALRTGDEASAELTSVELEELEADLRILGAEILNRNWDELAPVAKHLCHSCDFVPLCRRYPEFDLPPLPQTQATVEESASPSS